MSYSKICNEKHYHNYIYYQSLQNSKIFPQITQQISQLLSNSPAISIYHNRRRTDDNKSVISVEEACNK